MRSIKKFKPFFGIFCLFTLGLTGCNLKGNKEEDSAPVQTEPSFDIEADKSTLLLDKNDKITISVIKLISITDSELKTLEMAISSEINTCEGEITKSSTLGDFYFTAKKPGEAEISASVRTASGKVSAKSKIKVNAAYSTNFVKERITSVLTDKPILGENYDVGVSKNDLNNYSIANADGFLRFDEEGKLEVCGFGLVYPKISYKNEVLFDRSCQIFISTICTEIRESLYNQGKIERKEDNVPNNLLKYVTSINMSNVIINNPECALGIKYLENLEEIDLSNNELEELDFLSPLTKLKKINFAHNNIKDLSPLYKSERTLEEINLSDNNATSLSTLATFTKLKILDISENRISDIDFLSGVDSLVYLNLNHNNITKFIDGLSGLYSLKSLSLAYTGLNFVNIQSLKYLNQLDYLDISGSSSSLNQLTSYTNMKGLRVADCNLSQQSLAVLNEFTHLEILDISNNSLMNEKIDRELNASVLTNIKELSIGGNEFSEIPSIIKNFTNLEVLDLTNSYNITAIDQLKDLGIKELVLDECNSIGNDLLSNTMYAEQYLTIINSLTNLEKLSIVGGLNYMTKQVFDSLNAKVRSGTLSLRFLDDLYVDKNNISESMIQKQINLKISDGSKINVNY